MDGEAPDSAGGPFSFNDWIAGTVELFFLAVILRLFGVAGTVAAISTAIGGTIGWALVCALGLRGLLISMGGGQPLPGLPPGGPVVLPGRTNADIEPDPVITPRDVRNAHIAEAVGRIVKIPLIIAFGPYLLTRKALTRSD